MRFLSGHSHCLEVFPSLWKRLKKYYYSHHNSSIKNEKPELLSKFVSELAM